ncbi:MAG: MgtC/SapB family protein [Erysipelotrichaceae bacterium]|nr:MgtC/SapB family protein [Erysipelotrichaceae bacterium]
MDSNFEFEWILRVLCAVAAGVLIGMERHRKAKEAGIRTHAILALGACILTILAKYGFAGFANLSPSRIPASIVSGIGFLGAGIIFVRHDMIQGLTTAAGLWTTAAIAMCFGAGMYGLGICGTVLLFAIQLCFARSSAFSPPRNTINLRIFITAEGSGREISECLNSIGYRHTENHFSSDGEDGWVITTEIYTFRDIEPAVILNALNQVPTVRKAEIL